MNQPNHTEPTPLTQPKSTRPNQPTSPTHTNPTQPNPAQPNLRLQLNFVAFAYIERERNRLVKWGKASACFRMEHSSLKCWDVSTVFIQKEGTIIVVSAKTKTKLWQYLHFQAALGLVADGCESEIKDIQRFTSLSAPIFWTLSKTS